MPRTLAPLILIVLVLLGAWWIWPRAEPRALVQPPSAAAEVAPATRLEDSAKIESAVAATQRAEAASASKPAASAHLRVLCVARDDQRPLASVRVHLAGIHQGYRTGQGVAAAGRLGDELITGSDGRVDFEVEPGLVLTLNADDQAHFISQEGIEEIPALAAGETREVTLEHDAGEGAHLSGLVVARADGKPIENAEVLVNEQPRTSTDARGRFELDFSIHVPPWVRIRAKGFAEVVFTPEAGHEAPATARRIELERSAALEIALTMPPGEVAARVVLRGEGYELSQDAPFTSTYHILPPLTWEADADALWVCRFAELPPGVRIAGEVVGSTGVLFHTGAPIVLSPGETKHLAWDLRGCELVGHVYEPDGKPAAGIGLSLSRETSEYHEYLDLDRYRQPVSRAKSTADGSFRFTSVSPGNWLLSPDPNSRGAPFLKEAIAPVPQKVSVREGETSLTADVQLSRGLYIRGQLLAPDGETGAQGAVSALAEDKSVALVRTDAEGVFTLGPLAAVEFEIIGRPYRGGVESVPIRLRPPKEGVRLLARPAAEVAGVVVDGSSGAGTQAAITVAGEHASMMITNTEPNGSFQLDGLEPGIYTLFATTSDGRAGELAGVVLDLAAPAKSRQVVLAPGAKLRVRYEGAQLGDLRVLHNGTLIDREGVEGGRTATLVVPPGKLRVEFRLPGVETPEVQELEIGAGEERELVFKAPTLK